MESQDRSRQARELGSLALEYYQRGDCKNAIVYFQQFLTITRELKERRAEGVALTYLGNSNLSLKQYTRAVEFFQPGLQIVQEFNDRQGEGVILSGLGVAYENLGRFTRALESYQQLLEVARILQDFLLLGTALLGLSSTYDALGDYKRAIKFNQQALSTARDTANQQLEGRALSGLGNNYLSLEDYGRAVEYYQQSLAIARKVRDSEGEANTLGNLANAYLFLDQPKQALDALQRSLAIARVRHDIQAELETLSQLGLTYERLGDFKQALQSYQNSLAIARAVGDRLAEGIVLNNLGGAYLALSQLTTAEQNLRAATQVWQLLREDLSDVNRISLFERQARTYGLLQQVLIRQNRPQAALEIAEQGRARAFVALLATRLSTAGRQNSASLQISIDSPDIERIQRVAAFYQATLVEYSTLFDENLFIWVVQPLGKVIFCQIALKSLGTSLKSLVAESRNAILNQSQRGSERADETQPQLNELQQLYQLLIAPIVNALPTNPSARVIFIPQGSLFLVPFSALQNSSGQYLIEKHVILTAPSIQTLELIHQKHDELQSILLQEALVVGNPMPMPEVPYEPGELPQPLPSLPGAEQEAKAVAVLLNTQAIVGTQATKAAVLAQLSKVEIVHLATHGLLDDLQEQEIPGAIALAPSGQDNGLLTAEEILGMQLKARLVVLSACDTGRGRITEDGVIGLSRSLIAAGTPSVIVSLWSVEDESTALLMVRFYQNLQQGMAASIALNEAQRWLLRITQPEMETWLQANRVDFSPTLRINLRRRGNRPFQDPKCWAAFLAIGH